MAKKALITGITGQDGSYLAEVLLEKGYEVHGIKRRSSCFNTKRVDHIYQDDHEGGQRFFLYHGDMTDATSMIRLFQRIQPDEIYNLAAQSHVAVSFEVPENTADTVALGPLRILEAVRILGMEDKTRIYQASTSELYGDVMEPMQSETTPFRPRSPYAVAKQYGYWITVNYREAYGMHANNGILFNHESPRRGETFVTRKITRALTRYAICGEEVLYLGNMNAKRDWGHARDFVRAMWLILQQEEPDDYVIATGEQHSVRDFVKAVASRLEIDLEWSGEGLEEKAVDRKTGKTVVCVDPRYFRPTEVETLLGDASKAKEKLGWEPEISFDQLVDEMVEADLWEARMHRVCEANGFTIHRSADEE